MAFARQLARELSGQRVPRREIVGVCARLEPYTSTSDPPDSLVDPPLQEHLEEMVFDTESTLLLAHLTTLYGDHVRTHRDLRGMHLLLVQVAQMTP